jgi:hypothetical protein
MWNNGGMILTEKNRATWIKTCPKATFFNTNPAWTDLGTNPGIRGEKRQLI